MRKLTIKGCGKCRGSRTVEFGNQVRHYLEENQTLLDIIEVAVQDALKMANMSLEDIDLVVGGTATPLQPLPCNASIILERIGKNEINIPTMDINTSCTSFVTALDVISYLVDAGRYKNVLIVSGDTASAALNPDQKESFELFSDAATAFIISATEEDAGVVYANQKTWTAGVHDTEIRGGGALLTGFKYNEETKTDYYFDMKGRKVLSLCANVLPPFIDTCFKEAGLTPNDLDMVFPHQASKALPMIMRKVDFGPGTYVDKVQENGNMISAGIPYVLCEAIENSEVKRGDLLLLVGTAAGLTINFLVLKY